MGVAEPSSGFAPWAAAETLGLTAPELAAFQDEPRQMASGSVGKTGFLRLGFERRGDRTILADLDRRTPYMAQRALYPDPAMPDLAWLFMITTSGCVLQGDRLALEVTLAPRARAHVTTQSATKIHSMDANYAVQTQVDLARRRRLPRVPARAADPAPAYPLSLRHADFDRADGHAPLRGDRPAGAQAPSPRRVLRRHAALARRSAPNVPTGGRCSPRSS